MSSGRRYFRLLKWYPCWEIAWEKILAGSSSNGVGGSAAGSAAGGGGKGGKSTTLRQMLEGMKYAFLGMYFFLEMLTIVRNFSLFFSSPSSSSSPFPSSPHSPLPPRCLNIHIQTPPPPERKEKIHKLTPVTIQKNSPPKLRPMPLE